MEPVPLLPENDDQALLTQPKDSIRLIIGNRVAAHTAIHQYGPIRQTGEARAVRKRARNRDLLRQARSREVISAAADRPTTVRCRSSTGRSVPRRRTRRAAHRWGHAGCRAASRMSVRRHKRHRTRRRSNRRRDSSPARQTQSARSAPARARPGRYVRRPSRRLPDCRSE